MRLKEIILRERIDADGTVLAEFVLRECGAGGMVDERVQHSAALVAEDLPLRAAYAGFGLVQALFALLLAERPARMIVDDASGASVELGRLAAAFGCDLVMRLPDPSRMASGGHALRWAQGVFSMATHIMPPRPPHVGEANAICAKLSLGAELHSVPPPATVARLSCDIGYGAYAFGCRDHDLLERMQRGYLAHFEACTDVLDVGCGTGVFLELLTQSNIGARGVERNEMSVRYARSLGHRVVEDDAIAYLEANPASCDGLYCSHFIEHLPVEAAERLLAACAYALRPGGMALFVFPDPESIRSQFLGFWRDPEHVRFYHPELVAILARVHGFEVEFDSQRMDGRSVVSFSMQPPLPEVPPPPRPRGWARVLTALGIASSAQVALELAAERARADALEAALRKLWAVNQTWAWEDNAVLRLRKPG